MINFRFHLVSLIAVFLALALGIVVGSTLIDRAIVDALRNRIDTVEANLDDAAQANDELREERDELDDYVSASAPWAVEGRLLRTSVLVLAPRGLDGEVLDSTVVRLREAGAEVGGVVWFEEAWRLEEEEDRNAIADVLGLTRRPPEALRREATEVALAALLSDETPSTVLEDLAEAGFLALESVGDAEFTVGRLGGAESRAVVAVGNGAVIPAEEFAELLTRDLVSRGVPLTVAEVYEGGDDDPERGAALAFVRDDDELAAQASTVDDLEIVAGRVATVLALSELGQGRVGHYGIGVGAQSPLPALDGGDSGE